MLTARQVYEERMKDIERTLWEDEGDGKETKLNPIEYRRIDKIIDWCIQYEKEHWPMLQAEGRGPCNAD